MVVSIYVPICSRPNFLRQWGWRPWRFWHFIRTDRTLMAEALISPHCHNDEVFWEVDDFEKWSLSGTKSRLINQIPSYRERHSVQVLSPSGFSWRRCTVLLRLLASESFEWLEGKKDDPFLIHNVFHASSNLQNISWEKLDLMLTALQFDGLSDRIPDCAAN